MKVGDTKNLLKQLTAFWQNGSKKSHRILVSVVAGILLLAVLLTVVLNNKNAGYQVLYPNLSATESGSVYQALLTMGATPIINDKGEVMVPEKEYDIWILQLAAQGYPQTALTYDVFSSNSGLTATEFEKKQWLVFQLQDRIQETLSRMNGVESATVTINLAETGSNAWQMAQSSGVSSTAGVLLTLQSGVTLSGEQIAAIKNLVASSVPKMTADKVTVVDAKTGVELQEESLQVGITGTQNLEYEQIVQKQLEENGRRVLAPRYGAEGVVAVAKVTLDYDKMMTERLELLERPENGGGFQTHQEGRYTIGGQASAGGIVGEEDNTDIPQYGYNLAVDEGDLTYYWWSKDYDYGYIKTQIEKGNAELKRATISVMVAAEDLTEELREELIALVSGSTDIGTDNIFVSSFTEPVVEVEPNVEPVVPQTAWEKIPLRIKIAVGVGLLLLLGALVALIIIVKKKRKKARLLQEALEAEELARQRQGEIEQHKKELEEQAKRGIDVKDEAVMKDVRTFAHDNPQVTANLIRSWLKEGE